ncbi:hypothetical protein GHL01_00455 [Sinorhizobium meliloti]|uniref:hypothetical protein n=1 Tax=Rhizobium meliloti TaxID=382 RepID=UPI001294AD86|nr:hypothetical protein [Sinorhizobium meliloti]MQV12216.1 hypothetical protein [Sinorhizobium meliloti]
MSENNLNCEAEGLVEYSSYSARSLFSMEECAVVLEALDVLSEEKRCQERRARCLAAVNRQTHEFVETHEATIAWRKLERELEELRARRPSIEKKLSHLITQCT